MDFYPVTGAAVAFVGAAVLFCAVAIPGRRWSPARRWSIAGVWSVLPAFVAGCWIWSGRPRWPLAEDQDRLLAVLVPGLLLCETVAVALPRWLGWLPRLVAAVATLPILLYGSAYLTEAGGPGTRLWGIAELWAYLAAGAVLIGLAWLALDRSQRTASSWLRALALILVIHGPR